MKTKHLWSIMTYYLIVGILSTFLATTRSKESSHSQQQNEILQSFGYTGSFQRFVVPDNITNLIIDCYGAQGGTWKKLANSLAGLGGYISSQITVTPGQILYVYVGGQGQFETLGGYNGGGHARLGGGIDSCDTSGGGASDVRLFLHDISSRLVVAGGGGGAGTLSTGGAGGGIMGGSGTGIFGGRGGGIDNINERLRGTSILSQGIDSGYCGGAGGGGHHGGFGAHLGGGGGGSSHSVGPILRNVQGVQVGHGQVNIRFLSPTMVENKGSKEKESNYQPRKLQTTTKPTASPSTAKPSYTPTPKPTGQPTRRPTGQPSRQPSSQPSRQPTRQPSSQPSRQPTRQPSSQPSRQPTSQPSRQPTRQPSCRPTRVPSSQPSRQPSQQPISRPSRQPTEQPTSQPSRQPSSQPSKQPLGRPTSQPSRTPTMQPSKQPVTRPTSQPSRQPTQQPTRQPNRRPTSQPTRQPSQQPTSQPSRRPSRQPTRQPISRPSSQPSRQVRVCVCGSPKHTNTLLTTHDHVFSSMLSTFSSYTSPRFVSLSLFSYIANLTSFRTTIETTVISTIATTVRETV